MTMLEELNAILATLKIPAMLGFYSASEPAPTMYCVLTPIGADFDLYADDWPRQDTQEVRLTLYSKNNFLQSAGQLVRALLGAGFYVTDRLYVGYDREFGYHQYAIDVQKSYAYDESEE